MPQGDTPAPVLNNDEVPALAFGALSHLPNAACLLLKLPDEDVRRCKTWLSALAKDLAHGPRRRLVNQGPDQRASCQLLDHPPTHERAIVLALTATGLDALGLAADDRDTFPAPFVNGMTSSPRARALGDEPTEGWRWGTLANPVDAAILVYSCCSKGLEEAIAALPKAPGVRRGRITMQARKRGNTNEPFGFRDGLSQPVIRGLRPDKPTLPDQLVAAGEFVLGYEDNSGHYPPVPTVAPARDPHFILPEIQGRDKIFRRDLGSHSSYLVIRQLQQDLQEFERYVDGQAAKTGKSADLIRAKMLGRWPNGSSLVRHPEKEGHHADNDFRYGEEDADGLRCPVGAHIRRANPRDSLQAGQLDALAITNRHRILRLGRPYVRQPEDVEADGLLFMCLNADIERQFEFIQQSWLLRPSFNGLAKEIDPILGRNGDKGILTVPTEHGPTHYTDLKNFVTPLGGAYFWLPSRTAIQFLAAQ